LEGSSHQQRGNAQDQLILEQLQKIIVLSAAINKL